MGVTNAQLLKAIQELRDDELAEIKQKLDQVNGRVRDSEQVQAALVQWRRDHEKANAETIKELKDEDRVLRGRTNVAGVILAVSQAAATFGAFIFGQQKGP